MAAEDKPDKDKLRSVGPADPTDDDELEDVDLDLDAEDAVLSAQIGKPTKVRVAGKVITIPHMDAWDYSYSRMMSMGDFTGWAAGVLSEDDFRIWMEADLKNYQVTSIVAKVMANAAANLGKSVRSSQSSARKRGR